MNTAQTTNNIDATPVNNRTIAEYIDRTFNNVVRLSIACVKIDIIYIVAIAIIGVKGVKLWASIMCGFYGIKTGYSIMTGEQIAHDIGAYPTMALNAINAVFNRLIEALCMCAKIGAICVFALTVWFIAHDIIVAVIPRN